MIRRFLQWLSGSKETAANADASVRKEAPHSSASGHPIPPAEPADQSKLDRAPPQRAPVDLQIGLDVGTSCTKAVLGDAELGDQVAIPINGGNTLPGFLLPTQIFEDDGAFSLDEKSGSIRRRNLKIRVLRASETRMELEKADLHELTAFVALVLRRILSWAGGELARRHPNRTPVWYLNVGIPSKGGTADQFEPTYRRIIGAAVHLVPGDAPITREGISAALARSETESRWMPHARIHTFPEAGAQLASIMFSPYKPEGCLLVVDVGAGTLDVSTMRVRADQTAARCVLHCCTVSHLGAHFLDLARRDGWPIDEDFENMLDALPNDDGVTPTARDGHTRAPDSFAEDCRGVLLPTVHRYRMRLREAHLNAGYRPWTNGLPFVLSGGGQRDPFYQDLLQSRLPEWLSTTVSEWHEAVSHGPRPGLRRQAFPLPPRFGPQALSENFDRFSVAHGLSLGVDGLMEFRESQ